MNCVKAFVKVHHRSGEHRPCGISDTTPTTKDLLWYNQTYCTTPQVTQELFRCCYPAKVIEMSVLKSPFPTRSWHVVGANL